MKKLIPSLFILILVTSVILLFKNGATEEKQSWGTCNQVVCPKSGASNVTIDVYDGSTLFQSCNTGGALCCTITGLTSGHIYTAVYHNSTCPNDRVDFTACTGGNLQVPGCP